MTESVQQFAQELADREAIRECIYRYARGVDRCDEELMRQAYWPDGVDEHMSFVGSREKYLEWSLPILRNMDQTMHFVGNILIRIEGAQASVETYFQAIHRVKDGDRRFDVISAGRYVDKFEKRQDIWRVLRRRTVIDWFREYPDSADWERGILGMVVAPGKRYPDDISYALFSARDRF